MRMLLSHANVPFNNNIVQFKDWPALKPSMPNMQMPCLELADGTKMGQSHAILRFLGAKHGYYPSDALEAYQVDSLCDTWEGVVGELYKPHFARKVEDKEAMYPKIFDECVPKFLNIIEE